MKFKSFNSFKQLIILYVPTANPETLNQQATKFVLKGIIKCPCYFTVFKLKIEVEQILILL